MVSKIAGIIMYHLFRAAFSCPIFCLLKNAS